MMSSIHQNYADRCLITMGACWFAAKAYNYYVDNSNITYTKFTTTNPRESAFKKSISMHKTYCKMILTKNPKKLEKNSLALTATQIFNFCKCVLELLEEFINKQTEKIDVFE